MTETNPVIFRTYKTYGGYYAYDRHTDSVVALSQEEYGELRAVEEGELPTEKSRVIARYQRNRRLIFIWNTVWTVRRQSSDFTAGSPFWKLA